MEPASPDSRFLWILEDDPELRYLMAYFARNEGIPVIEASSLQGAEQLRKDAVQLQEPPLAIISDLNLEDGKTEAFLARCRQSFPSAPIFCVSGDMDSSLASRFAKLNILGLSKPASIGDILNMVSKALSTQ